jgi:hypothetical protein
MSMVPFMAMGQEVDYDSLLQRVDTVENPVYKPVISFSYGVLNFLGDVRNSYITSAIGNNAFQVNVATFVDRKHYFTGNFYYLSGKLSGNSYSHTDLESNLNFQTDISVFGANLEYRFGHLFEKDALVRPYVSVGVGNLNYSAKGDLTDANGLPYYYWSDGTIRDIDEALPGPSSFLYRDYDYETDLRLREEQEFGLGKYNQRSLVIPLTLGAHFRIGQRAFFSLGVAYHYAFSDLLDNVAYEGTSVQGAKGNDSYIYSHLGLHFDLFSDPTTRTVDLMFADAEFDPVMFDDEDGDFVLDVTDRCPGTPFGVEVDTLGCPLDGDGDLVPDYLDQELDTPERAWVDDEGITVTRDEFAASMDLRNHAMAREDVEEYMAIIRGEYRLESSVEIPENFVSLDVDGDGYLSFDELILVIDKFFDSEVDMDIGEVRDLNNFFFAQ